jgi:prepilin-type N-terminal cleavage/methylation domain-containing protein
MSQTTQVCHRSPGPACRPLAFRRDQRGLTLVELMIAVLVASLLIGFVFDIQGRMSAAFRSQTNIGSLQQGVRAANEQIARDARLTGFMAPNEIRVSSKFVVGLPGLTPGLVRSDAQGNFVPPLFIANNPSAMPPDRMQPDRIHFFYADPNPVHQAVVQSIVGPTSVVVNGTALFQAGDLVLFARRDPTPRFHPLGGNLPLITNYFTCMVRLTGVDSFNNQLFFDDDSPEPFNTAGNEHCFLSAGTQEEAIAVGKSEKTQVFHLIAHAYQIDTTPARLPVAALERSETAGLRDDWQEIGIGFVDLQISQRYVEEVADATDLDGDGDPRVDWYTSDGVLPANLHLTQIGIGLVARTPRSVEGVRATAVPVLTGANCAPGCTVANNPFGDAGGPKDMTQPEYNPEAEALGGEHVYRQNTSIVDIRNLGVSY